MIDNQQLGYPSGSMPEDQPRLTPQSDLTGELVQVGQDNIPQGSANPAPEIPADPLDLATVAQAVMQEVDWTDAAAYSQAYTDRVVQANQYSAIPENVNQGPIPTVGPLEGQAQ
jgi:hypothetical protein